MNAGRLIVIGAGVAALAYWESQTGALSDAVRRYLPEVNDAFDGAIDPIQSPVTSTDDIWMQRLLDDQWYVQGYALANLNLAAAIMEQEIGGLPVTSQGSAGELGVFQVKPSTAEEMYNRGYDSEVPNESTLKTVWGSIYFGTAYLDYLSTYGKDRDWIIAAYNGGPGWEAQGETYRAARIAYRDKVIKKIQRREAEQGA